MTFPVETIFRRSGSTVYRVVEREAVIVEPLNGLVNVTNETGSRIWELIDGKRSAGRIAELIASEYDISDQAALSDSLDFLSELSNNKLVEIVG